MSSPPLAWRVLLLERVIPVISVLLLTTIVALFATQSDPHADQLFMVIPSIASLALAVAVPTDAWLCAVHPWIIGFHTIAVIVSTIDARNTYELVMPAWLTLVTMLAIQVFQPESVWLWTRIHSGFTIAWLFGVFVYRTRCTVTTATVAACSLAVQVFALRPSARMWLSQQARMATLHVPLCALRADDIGQLSATGTAARPPYAASAGVALAQPRRRAPGEVIPETLELDSAHSGSVADWSAASPILHGNDSWTFHSMSSRTESLQELDMDGAASLAPSSHMAHAASSCAASRSSRASSSRLLPPTNRRRASRSPSRRA